MLPGFYENIFSDNFFVSLFIASAVFIHRSYFPFTPKFTLSKPLLSNSIEKSAESFLRLKTKASLLKQYIVTNYYNSKICFLVDMKISSGKNRFFVYDLQQDTILICGLVAHGSCDNGFQLNTSFSNKVNSGCSSFGKFKIGESYTGRFGLAYKLYGLDSSNSNAYGRTIVLHAYGCVPELEVYPLPLCNSRGCPMVSPMFLKKLRTYLYNTSKPVLLSIYE